MYVHTDSVVGENMYMSRLSDHAICQTMMAAVALFKWVTYAVGRVLLTAFPISGCGSWK
jgi:hypothetical protein